MAGCSDGIEPCPKCLCMANQRLWLTNQGVCMTDQRLWLTVQTRCTSIQTGLYDQPEASVDPTRGSVQWKESPADRTDWSVARKMLPVGPTAVSG
jgi:hypothetical protein